MAAQEVRAFTRYSSGPVSYFRLAHGMGKYSSVIAVTKGAMSDIKSNTFVGITACKECGEEQSTF
jgi:hypothetical protein